LPSASSRCGSSASTRRKRTSKEGQRLKQRRQPLQISNTRWSSDSMCALSQKTGLSYAIPCGSADQSCWPAIGSLIPVTLVGLVSALCLDLLQPLGEAARVRLLGLGQGLEPLGHLPEAFLARLLGESRVHLRVLVGLTGHGGLQVLLGVADGLPGRRIADLLQVFEVAVGVARLALGGVAEEARDVRPAFHVGLLGEVQVTPVCLALAGERGLEVLVGLAVLEIRDACCLRRGCAHVGESFSKIDSPRQAEVLLRRTGTVQFRLSAQLGATLHWNRMRDESANRRLKIEAHDASRVEWSIYIPLPRGREINEAEVSLRLEFPENAYVPHDGWEQLQILPRLSSPDEQANAAGPATADGVR